MLFALSTSHKVGLATTGAIFIVYALVSSFVLPRRNPNFPGRFLVPYVLLSILMFVAMMSAVLVFGKEPKEATAATATATTPAATTPAAPSSGGGDAAAGKAVFASAGCAGCHTMKAANASGTVGPNLDDLKPSIDSVTQQVDNGGGAMPSFKGSLSAKQIADVAAFVYQSTHS